MERTVWVFGDARMTIYEETEDVGTLPQPSVPLLQYCYLQGFTLSAAANFTRRAVTGRGRKKIVMLSDYENITLQCSHFFYSKELEINTDSIFNSNKQLRLILELSKLEYTGLSPLENDTFALSFARAINFSVTGQDDQNINATANFEAELFV